MPVTWDEARYSSTYRIRIRDPNHPLHGQKLGYTRLGMARVMDPYSDTLDLYNHHRDKLVSLFPIGTADRILVAGCGLGFLIEAFKDGGHPNVWGIDNSPYVAAKRGTDARGDVLWVEDDIRGGGRVRNALRTMTGANHFRWVVSESVVESYTDAELPPLLDAAESVLTSGQPLSNIIHLFVPLDPNASSQDPAFQWRTLAQANTIRPSHSWVDMVRWQVA